MSSHKVIGKMFTYQIQHRFNNIPVANLSSLDQSGKNGKFHLDIPDRNRWIHNPSREDHWTWSGHHHCLTGRSGDCSRVLPVTWRRLSVRERQRARHCHRSTACHFQPNRELSGAVTLSLCNILNHCSGASRKKNEINTREKKTKTKKSKTPKKKSLSVSEIHSEEFWSVCPVWNRCRAVYRADRPAMNTQSCAWLCRSHGCAPFSGCAAVTAMLPPPTCRPAYYACGGWDTGDLSLRHVLRGVGWSSQDRLASITLDRHLM